MNFFFFDGKKFFKKIPILPNIKIPFAIFIYENTFFMFYHIPLFSVKSAFCLNSTVLFLLIKLKIQHKLEP